MELRPLDRSRHGTAFSIQRNPSQPIFQPICCNGEANHLLNPHVVALAQSGYYNPAVKDFLDLVHDPKHRQGFERLLRLAARRGDGDIVEERLSWGIDPNAASKKGTTALIANVRSCCPNVATVKALLAAGADPNLTDHSGCTALDYARRKLAKLEARPRKTQPKSPSLDENDQLRLSPDEQAELDDIRNHLGPAQAREFIQIYWKERLRAARRKFNDYDEVVAVVQILEQVTRP